MQPMAMIKNSETSYQCVNPVVIMIFNRPGHTLKVFKQIRKVRPQKLYVISDGARESVETDQENVIQCRNIVSNIDWPCKVINICSHKNLGCKKRVITGLNEVFAEEENAIILEDDCVPTQKFFEFCDWGLMHYKNEEQVGIISGSNLLDYLGESSSARAGFSMYINCLGWATWRRTWEKFDPLFSLQELRMQGKKILQKTPLSPFQRMFWSGVFRHAIYSQTIWDFYLQYAFFKHGMLSVYPIANLVENIGFDPDATHRKDVPEFVNKSRPREVLVKLIMERAEPTQMRINRGRDNAVLKIVYGYSPLSTCRLMVGNQLRYAGLL
jgi:hypothetical protein